jgi:hypothetical protein
VTREGVSVSIIEGKVPVTGEIGNK